MNIGILIRESGRFYSDPLLSGMHDYCSEKALGITVFSVGKSIPMGERSRWRDFFLKHMADSPIDALICVSSTLSLDSGELPPEDVFAAFGDIPKVSIGVPMKSAALVSSDPQKGISELVDHMADRHGYRRFGFIGGPDYHLEGRRRFELFRNKLQEHGIEFDENCLFSGDFEHDSGRRGIDAFFERGCLDSMDAILCANDHMALGAWKRLQLLGYEVPGRIALAGFDNADLELNTENPLTTVHQGIRSLGYESARTCHEAFLENRPAADTVIPSHLVVRGSCGCLPNGLPDDHFSAGPDGEASSLIEQAVEKVKRRFRNGEFEFDGFRSDWSLLVNRFLRNPLKIGDILKIAWRIGDEAAVSEERRRIIVSTAIRIAVEIISRDRFIEISASNEITDRLDQFGYRVFGLDRHEDFGGILEEELFSLGFSFCMIGVFESRDGLFDRIRPIACSRQNGCPETFKLDADGTYSTSSLLPDGMIGKNEETLMVLPLGRGEDARGLAILDFNPKMLHLYSGIASRLSMSMRIWSNIESLENEVHRRRLSEAVLSETVLRDELTGLYNRRGFMVRARERLNAVQSAGGLYAVVYSDLDGLKIINDRWGHDAGDEALKSAGAALKKSVRDEDVVARIGGDEYALFVHLGKGLEGETLKKRLCDSIDEADAYGKERGRRWKLSMSFGVVESDDPEERLDELMTQADAIQYREKERKRAERRRSPE